MTAPAVHATFENAWRLAATMAEARDEDFAVVRTHDAQRPYVVDNDVTHRDAVAVIISIASWERPAAA